MSAHLCGAAAAVPPSIDQQDIWDGWFGARYENMPGAERIWRGAGVRTRHAVIDPRLEDVSGWSTARRMDRYLAEAVPLAAQAASRSLGASGVRPEQVDSLVTVSCTGYATPGVDLLVANRLGLKPGLHRTVVGHMGCYAAVPALRIAADAAMARASTVLVICVELTSLHLQPADRDVDQLVSHALFSDAAAAFVVRPDGRGLRVVDVVAAVDSAHLDAMTWTVTDRGFRMGLSPRVPSIIRRGVQPAVLNMLEHHGLDIDGVAAWAIHPGGPRILDACQQALGLDESALAPSRRTLDEHGNCSSATIVMVLERVVADVALAPGDHVVAMAFGPGLTFYAALLQYT